MDYQIAKLEHLDQIIEMKNLVRQKIKDEKLDIWRNNYPLDELLNEDTINKLGRVVVYQNKIIAYAVFYHSSYEYKNCFKKSNVYSFGRLMVHPDFQSKKVGSFIVAKMIEEAKSLHVEGLVMVLMNVMSRRLICIKSMALSKKENKTFLGRIFLYTRYIFN